MELALIVRCQNYEMKKKSSNDVEFFSKFSVNQLAHKLIPLCKTLHPNTCKVCFSFLRG